MPNPRRSERQGLMLFLGLGMALTIEIAAAAGVGFWIGTSIDKRMGCAPLAMISGIVIFISASITHAIIALKQAQARLEKEE